MIFKLVLVLCCFHLPAEGALSPLWGKKDFLEFQKKQKKWQARQKRILSFRLKALWQKKGNKNTFSFLQHQKKSRNFEARRKDAFLEYKRKQKRFDQRKKQVLASRLKKLKNLRHQYSAINDQYLFSLGQ